jgi:FkbM family methyltransferase
MSGKGCREKVCNALLISIRIPGYFTRELSLTMGNDAFDHEYDLESLKLISPRGHEFAMYVTPRYRYHYETQEYERYTARLVARVLSRHSLFVDIGANYGFYTLLAATQHPQLEVLALEPVEATFEVLKRNTELLSLGNVRLHQLAAADADGTASFHISMAADNCGFSPHPAAPPLRQVEVRTARLDTLLADRTPCPVLVKIDVEGHELAVLRGMKDAFARFADLSLLVEFNPKMQEAAGARPEDLLRELDRLGFAVFLLDDERCRHYRLTAGSDWPAWLARLHYANLYCVRKEAALNLCLFSHSSQLGGAERTLLELVKQLVADHGAVCSVVLSGPGPLGEALEKAGVACLSADYGWWGVLPPEVPGPDAVWRLKPQLQFLLRDVLPAVSEIDPDFLWTQTLVIPWGAVTAALLGKPHVWSVREYGELDHGIRFFAPFSQVVEDILACSALVYTCGKAVGETLFPQADAGHWRVLYPHIRVPEPPAHPVPTGLFQREGAIRLGVFATLIESKGQEDAICAVATLVAEGKNVELLLAGYGDARQRRRLEALIAEHSLQAHVRLPGFLADPFPTMRETDIILVCSRLEAFGRVGLEGMLLGKPVVFAAVGGSLEYMVDGRTGLSYPAGDAGRLAEAIRQLLADPAKRASLGTEAQRAARTRFSREAYGGEVYRNLCALRMRGAVCARMPSIVQPLLGPAKSGAAGAAVRWKRVVEACALREELTRLRAQTGLLVWFKRFIARQKRSARKRQIEVGDLLFRAAVGLGWTRRLHRLRKASRLIRDSGLFDAEWYLERYLEAHWGRLDPILHYLTRGADCGCDPNPFFDSRWYAEQNADVSSSGLSPLEHYLRFGVAKGRDPSPRFCAQWYTRQYPDAHDSGLTPLGHYLQRGQAAGYQTTSDAGFALSSRYADSGTPFRPEITVIVPNYNHAPYLRQRLDSIYGQTYRNFRVILLDDCSTDESRAILGEYAKNFSDRTKVLFNHTNSGCAFAQWKKGLEHAQTDLVWIAESDDFCDTDFLEGLVPFFRDEAVQIAYCTTVFVGADGRPLDFSFEAYTGALDTAKWKSNYVETAHREVRTALGIRNTIPNVSSALLRHPGNLPLLSDPDWLKMRICGDWVFYLHHARGGKIAYSRNTSNYYRYHQSNASRNTYKEPHYYREHEAVGKTIAKLYRVEPSLFDKQRDFLREHWEYVFKDEGPPAWRLEDEYDLSRIRAEASGRLPNVLVAGYDFATGGGEVFAIRLAGALKEKGFGVTFYDFNAQEANPEFRRLLPSNIPVVQRNEHGGGISKIIEGFGIEIVHTHHANTDDYFATRLRPNSGRPCHIVTMHGMYEVMEAEYCAQHLPKLMTAVEHWVYVADKNLEPFRRQGLYNQTRFTKIGYGMKRPTVAPIGRTALGIPEEAFVICVASRALPEKGWVESIQAVKCSRRETARDIHLVLLGNGAVYDLLTKEGIPSYVHLLGFKPNPVDYYAMADLGLLASKYRSECRPLTIIECLMAGRPVVASDVGEIRSMITAPSGGLAGALIGLQDWEIPVGDLSASINKFVEDKAAYGEAASLTAAAAKQFDIYEIVKQYSDLYARVLAD